MVLGLRTKSRKGTSIQVDYIIHIQEIKPWPPSQSLKSLRSVLLQWENGDRSSGSTNPVIPSLGSSFGDGKIEFNESFRLPVTLSREVSIKGGDTDIFQKNCLEFNLYEPRRDKTVKGQLLGTVIIDLAEYGIVKEAISVNAPMNSKRSFRNTAQPVLFIRIQPLDKDRFSSSSKESISKEASLDKDGVESVSALMSEEYAEEAEVASFTDDDVSSHSSLTISSTPFETSGNSPSQNEENTLERTKDGTKTGHEGPDSLLEPIPAKKEANPPMETFKHLNGSSSSLSSIDLTLNPRCPEKDHASLSILSDGSLSQISKNFIPQGIQSSSLSTDYEAIEEEVHYNNRTRSLDDDSAVVNGRSKIQEENNQPPVKENRISSLGAKVACLDTDLQADKKAGLISPTESQSDCNDGGKLWVQKRNESEVAGTNDGQNASVMKDKVAEEQAEDEHNEQIEKHNSYSTEDEPFIKFSQDAIRKELASNGDSLSFSSRALGIKGNTLISDRLKHVKSVRSPLDSARGNGLVSDNQFRQEVNEVEILENAHNGTRSFRMDEGKAAKLVSRETKSNFSDRKIQQLERRIERLEGELREAAALEVGLYAVVAEHGSSGSKVHAPARRLYRLYVHACKESIGRRASAARSAISGLVLVAKACGNDVPRLTFWLSNTVVLRAIISQAVEGSKLPISAGPHIEFNGGGKGNEKVSSPLKWKESSPNKRGKKFDFALSFDDWEDPHTFTTALEKIETWIFSRIIESIWWQTLTPYMQSSAEKASSIHRDSGSNLTNGRRSSLGVEEQVIFSLDLWKKAFKDAFERLCPLRAGGHECGCLPVLARLVMEQCVGRLDVAMFNAILRESGDEIPSDPVSDPVSDSKVLPISAGKSSFGAGAQLKNAIGNWSRWLTDLFGIDDDDSPENENELDDGDRQECDTSLKSFHLLNALSDLMMLPKDMLLNKSIRKEVCPTFSASLIRRVLMNFDPDEFCPDPIPEAVFKALDSEDPIEEEDESVKSFPCNADPIVYSPPSATSLTGFIGEVGTHSQLQRSGSSALQKSYTSEDELDELDSPISSIIIDSFRASPTSKDLVGRNAVRYQLLREVWRDDN